MDQDPDAIFIELAQKVDDLIMQITAFSAQTTPDEFRRALDDQLAARGLLAQVVEVMSRWREQIMALTEAYTRLSVAVKTHDEISATERKEIVELLDGAHMLLVSLAEVTRDQVRLSADIARAVGADVPAGERKRRAKEKPA